LTPITLNLPKPQKVKVNTTIPGLRPEDQFILACLQQQVSLPELDFDEDQLIHRMDYHRVSSMVYQHLLKIDGLHILSAKTQSQLKEHYHLNVYHNLAISSLVTQITKILGENNIETLALKGAMFLESFPNYALVREMSDLDIMVKPEKLEQALEVLFKRDFEDLVGFRESKSQRKKWSIQTCCNAIPIKNQKSSFFDILIEVHWQLFSANNQTLWSEKDLWERAQYCSKSKIYKLDPIDIILHLCAHQCNDLQIYLYSLVDVANVLKFWGRKIDWAEVIYRAKSQRLLFHLVNVLRLSNELLNAPLPEVYFTSLQSYELKAQPGYNFLLERLFQKELIENSSEANSLLKVFRRLEYSNFWHGLWFELKLPIPLGIRLRLNYYIGRHLREGLGFH
jgi:hypothetical protein